MEFTPSNTTPLWEESHLSKGALVRWRNHTLSPAEVVEASEHLAVCAQCRDQLAAPTSLLLLAQALDNGQDELALVRNPELQHLNFEQMEAFVDELLTPAGRRNVERHLALCEVCSSQVADLQAVQRDLRDWQPSSQSLPEAAVPVSTTSNGATPYNVGAQQLESSPTFVAPPMRVALASGDEEKSRSSWWDILRNVQRYLLPLETAAVAVSAVFLLVIGPWQQEMANQKARTDAALTRSQNQSQQSDAQIKQLRDRVASLSKRSATTQQTVQQLAKDKAALTSQSNETQSRLRATQSELAEAQSQLGALREQRRNQERFAGRPSASPSSAAPHPTSPSQNVSPPSSSGVQMFSDGPNSRILVQDGRAIRVRNVQSVPDEAARVLSQGLQTPASVKALRVPASTSKSAETQLRVRLLSPVATRVRKVLPLLRWEAVSGAKAYRVTLVDETDLESPPLKSDLLNKPQWQPEEPLIRGHRYSWTVQAWKQDQSSGKSSAIFEILTQAQEDALQAQLNAINDSPLEKSVALAKAGVMDEAQRELSLVTRPKAASSTRSR